MSLGKPKNPYFVLRFRHHRGEMVQDVIGKLSVRVTNEETLFKELLFTTNAIQSVATEELLKIYPSIGVPKTHS